MEQLKTVLQNEYVQAVLIIAASLLFAKVFLAIIFRYLKKLTEKTDTHLDEGILKIINTPLYLLIFITGVYYALHSLSVLEPYALWIDRLHYSAGVLVAALVISRVLVLVITHWLHVEKQYERSPRLVGKMISVIVYLLAFVMILNYFKINITPIIATLGVGGLAVGLALQGTLSNFFAGLHIITDNPFSVGDYIELNEWSISGYVEDIGWRTTKVKTLPNNIVVVPNAKIAESVVINNYMPEKEMAALVQCGVAYGSDLKKVEKVTIDVARHIQQTVEGAVKSFEPFIRYHTFADSNINFSIILRVQQYVDKHLVTHEFIKALKERYDAENIEISWPVRKIFQG
jgi:small-conductance mechanosensitive channel